MKIIDGRKIAQKIRQELKGKVKKLKIKPGLAVILVGQEPASKLYVSLKEKAAKEIGIRFYKYNFNKDVSQKKVLETIKKLNQDKKIHGLIVQLPLPGKFNTDKIIRAINPKKDVDGFHPENLTLFKKNRPRILPVFPMAILKILEATKKKLTSKKAMVLVNSRLFGQVLTYFFKKKGLPANYILKLTCGREELKKKLSKADILISACGCPNLIDGSMIKTGAIVIDGGVTKIGRKILGDVDVKSVATRANFISPVPGGVGPVNVALLLNNTYLLAKKYGRK